MYESWITVKRARTSVTGAVNLHVVQLYDGHPEKYITVY